MADVLHFRLVDAFADRPYTGNPAGVILNADGLYDAQMQAIAAEINASETAFLLGRDDPQRPPRIRWFTPTVEVGFCGHATLAAAHAHTSGERGRPARPTPADATIAPNLSVPSVSSVATTSSVPSVAPTAEVTFDSPAGPLRLRCEPSPAADGSAIWWLEMPDPVLRPDNTNPMKTCELLGMSIDDLAPSVPIVRTRDDDLVLLVRSWQRLMSLQPDAQALGAWCARHGIRGVCVATREAVSGFAHVTSRFFAPAAGVPEDPVTGSVHGPLSVLLVTHGLVPLTDGRAGLNCLQGRPGGRGGLVRSLVERHGETYRVTIGGACHTTIRGEMAVPRV